MSNIRQQLISGSRARGLDPRAVLAVALQEGLSGRVGDQGTSFGPFQLHVGGAFPRRIGGNRQAWAMSPQGIAYALNQIAHVARGKHGAAAINAIVRQFERPANPGAEVSRALGSYGKVGGGAAGVSLAPRPVAAGLTAAPDRSLLMQQLVGELGHRQPDIGTLAGLIQQSKAISTPAQIPFRPRAQTPLTGNVRRGASGINELFYDPIGGIKHGRQIGAIGHHFDHVHISLATEQAQKAALAQARRMGLRVGQESDADVTHVHVPDSYHYQHYRRGDPLRKAADVSGEPKRMAAFYRWVASTFR